MGVCVDKAGEDTTASTINVVLKTELFWWILCIEFGCSSNGNNKTFICNYRCIIQHHNLFHLKKGEGKMGERDKGGKISM